MFTKITYFLQGTCSDLCLVKGQKATDLSHLTNVPYLLEASIIP